MATVRELYLYIMNTEWAYRYYENIAREVVKKENANTSSDKHKWKSAQQVRKGILPELLSKGIIKQDLGKNGAKQLDQMIYNDLMEYVADETFKYVLFIENRDLPYNVPPAANKDEAASLAQMWMRENFISEAVLDVYKGIELVESIHIYA